jgi:hypothetical protein
VLVMLGSSWLGGAGKESSNEDEIAALFGSSGNSGSESELAGEGLISIENETFFLCLLPVVLEFKLEKEDEAEIVRL